MRGRSSRPIPRRVECRQEVGGSAMAIRTFTAWVHREDGGWVALCPELDVASQGQTVEEAKANLREAVELFLDCADEEEISQRLHGETYMSSLEVDVG